MSTLSIVYYEQKKKGGGDMKVSNSLYENIMYNYGNIEDCI